MTNQVTSDTKPKQLFTQYRKKHFCPFRPTSNHMYSVAHLIREKHKDPEVGRKKGRQQLRTGFPLSFRNSEKETALQSWTGPGVSSSWAPREQHEQGRAVMYKVPHRAASSWKVNTTAGLHSERKLHGLNERYTCTVIAPARDSGKPPAIHEEPLKNLVAPINGPFTEYLKRNKADDDTIKEGM